MGQKINPTIFRLGINKTWNTEYFESKKSELPLYTFKNLEIKEYIQKFLSNNGLLMHNYKIQYNKSLINIYISYFVPTDYKFKSVNNFQKIQNKNQFKEELSINKFNESIGLFTSKRYKINTVFQCINKNFNLLTLEEINFLKTRLALLKKFKNGDNFNFEETFNLISAVVYNKNSSFLLSNFIGKKLKKIKKHNRFLSCITRILELLIFSNFSKIKGIKIKISGKLNRARRTKDKIIQIGDIPAQTINISLDYSQTTVTHNPNGSLGIKVWIIEK